MADDFLNDPALLQDFLVESEELLQGMDQDMVALETALKDADLLNRIFRAMHTIKGTSGFLGLDPIVKLAHKAEDVLNALRRGECPLTRALMDAMLKARDQLGRMLSDLRNGSFGTYALEDLLHELASVLAPHEKQPERKSEPVRVETIRGAVVNLGLRRMREIAMSCYLLQLMPTSCPLDPTLFWEHALGVALASRRFAAEIGFPGPDKAYLAGLLHDFGVIMSFWVAPEDYAKVFALAKAEQIPLAEAEMKCLGLTHCEVGRVLGGKWQMPRDILQVVTWHHEPEKAPEQKALVALVSLADLLCRMSGMGYGYAEARQIVFSEQPAFQVLLDACPDLKKLDWERFTFDMEAYLGEVERLVKLVYRPI